MSFNIMDAVKGQINDQLVGQIGGLLGESPDKTRSAIDGALPALLAGIGDAAQEPAGADTLFNLVDNQDDGLLDNISFCVFLFDYLLLLMNSVFFLIRRRHVLFIFK